MSKNNLNDYTSQSLRESIFKVLEEGPTSQRNLEQFRERQNQEREAMRARGQEINAARRERNAQISAETAKHSGSREAAMDTLNKSVEFQRLSATANRGQGQQNTIGGEQQRTEGQSPAKGFGVGRGFGGKPVITGGSYVSPNSAEARVRKDVDAGKLPASFGQYQGNRLPMDLAKEREDAGNAEFDQSINDDLGIENASKMNRNELESKAKNVVAQRTLDLDQNLRSKDYKDNGVMPNVQVGQEIKDFDSKYAEISKKIANTDREYKDASALQSFNDSLKGEQLKNQAQMDLSAKAARAKQDDDDREDMYAGMRQHQTLPHGEIPPAPKSATVGSMIPNQNAASRVATLFAPGVSTPKSSFKDAVRSVAQSSTPNVPQTEPVKDEDNSEARLRVTRSYNADNAARSYDAKQEMLRKRAEREAREREDAQRNTTPKTGTVNPISLY